MFNIYVDELSVILNELFVGCYFNNMLINHLLYADDIILMCPSHSGLQTLVNECAKFGAQNDIIFNVNKTVCMVIRTKEFKRCNIPEILLNNSFLKYVDSYKYLGHLLSETLSDDKDILRQRRNMQEAIV